MRGVRNDRTLPVEMLGDRIGTRRIVRVWFGIGGLWVRLLCDCGKLTDRCYSHLTNHSRNGGPPSGEFGCLSCAAIAYRGTLTNAEARRILERGD